MRSVHLLLPAVAVALACSGSTEVAPVKTPASISFSRDSVTTFPGGSVVLPVATVYDSAHEIIRSLVTWSSLTPAVASVNGSVAQGRALGVATMEATSGPASATVRVGVAREPVVGIGTNYYSRALYGIDSTQLLAYALGPLHDTLDREVTLSSLTPDIATITSTGMIHGHKTGIARILATTDDLSAEFPITIDVRRVARIVAIPDSLTLIVGQEVDSLRFQAFDAHGDLLENRPIFLQTSNQYVVAIDYYLFPPYAAHVGTAYLIATSDTAVVHVPVTVNARP